MPQTNNWSGTIFGRFLQQTGSRSSVIYWSSLIFKACLVDLFFFLDHFQPSEEILAEGLPADEELAEDQDLDDMYTLDELFKELESGDPVKAGKLILQKKKLFVPMRKHFQVMILLLFMVFQTQYIHAYS